MVPDKQFGRIIIKIQSSNSVQRVIYINSLTTFCFWQGVAQEAAVPDHPY